MIAKVNLSLSMRRRRVGGPEVQLHSFLTSALDGGERQTARGKNRRLCGRRGWAGLGVSGKRRISCLCRESNQKYKSWSLPLCSVLHSPVTCLLDPNTFRCTLLHDTLALCSDFLHHTMFHTHTVTVLYIVILEFSGIKVEGSGELVKVNQSHSGLDGP